MFIDDAAYAVFRQSLTDGTTDEHSRSKLQHNLEDAFVEILEPQSQIMVVSAETLKKISLKTTRKPEESAYKIQMEGNDPSLHQTLKNLLYHAPQQASDELQRVAQGLTWAVAPVFTHQKLPKTNIWEFTLTTTYITKTELKNT